MILVIGYEIMRIKKSLGVEMQYSMKRLCTNISCRERNEKENTEYIVFDEIKENEFPKEQENKEQQQVSQTAPNVRRYTRLSRPPERFSPSQYFY